MGCMHHLRKIRYLTVIYLDISFAARISLPALISSLATEMQPESNQSIAFWRCGRCGPINKKILHYVNSKVTPIKMKSHENDEITLLRGQHENAGWRMKRKREKNSWTSSCINAARLNVVVTYIIMYDLSCLKERKKSYITHSWAESCRGWGSSLSCWEGPKRSRILSNLHCDLIYKEPSCTCEEYWARCCLIAWRTRR